MVQVKVWIEKLTSYSEFEIRLVCHFSVFFLGAVSLIFFVFHLFISYLHLFTAWCSLGLCHPRLSCEEPKAGQVTIATTSLLFSLWRPSLKVSLYLWGAGREHVRNLRAIEEIKYTTYRIHLAKWSMLWEYGGMSNSSNVTTQHNL